MGQLQGNYELEIIGSITLSAADTYTEVTETIPIDIQGKRGILITRLEVELPYFDAPALQDRGVLQICSGEQLDILSLDDSELIGKVDLQCNILTSGLVWYSRVQNYPMNRPYAKSKIYVGAKTVGQADARTFKYKIKYVPMIFDDGEWSYFLGND